MHPVGEFVLTIEYRGDPRQNRHAGRRSLPLEAPCRAGNDQKILTEGKPHVVGLNKYSKIVFLYHGDEVVGPTIVATQFPETNAGHNVPQIESTTTAAQTKAYE